MFPDMLIDLVDTHRDPILHMLFYKAISNRKNINCYDIEKIIVLHGLLQDVSRIK